MHRNLEVSNRLFAGANQGIGSKGYLRKKKKIAIAHSSERALKAEEMNLQSSSQRQALILHACPNSPPLKFETNGM
jgi:hypothetical protein